jgi:immune inhibitor A
MSSRTSNRRSRYRCVACAGPAAQDLIEETTYADGPTTCMAHPRVRQDISQRVRKAGVLSSADARMAQGMGLLSIPSVGRTGWNDGVIYPLAELPLLSAASPQRSPSRRAALPKAEGTMHCLVLLVDFSDNPGKTPPAHYEKLLFDPNHPGSMNRFYREMSYGKLNVTGQVVGWLRAPQPYSYYVDGQSGTGNRFPKNTPGLLQDILKKWTAKNSLKPFDLNGDGFVDGLFLVHAGPGAETQASAAKRAAMIWSHKWVLPTPFDNHGVKAYAYFTAPEDGRLGVFSHEFGHFIGLPDLYDTSYRSRGVGDWCLMAGGSWLGEGEQPARLSAWCLQTLGWIKPTVVKPTIVAGSSSGASLTLASLEQDAKACLRANVGSATSPEYFLLENRQQMGRDALLPGHGLALWHIDERQADNTNPLAFRVGLVQADGKRDLELNVNDGEAADLFPGPLRVTSVGDKSLAAPNRRRCFRDTFIPYSRDIQRCECPHHHRGQDQGQQCALAGN